MQFSIEKNIKHILWKTFDQPFLHFFESFVKTN